MKDKIIEHAKTNYSSSPHEFTDEEIETIIKVDCKCESCDKSIFELHDFPKVINGEVLCEDCYEDEYIDRCLLCEESYERLDDEDSDFPKSPFYLSIPSAEEQDMKPGIYVAISYPVFRSDMFSTTIYKENIKLICEADDFLEKYPEYKEVFEEEGGNFICLECLIKAKKCGTN